MSIQDFYKKFVSVSESNGLVESLRRLSVLDDPKSMFEGELQNEWSIWTDGSGGLAASQA
jgi:hypothetical protein